MARRDTIAPEARQAFQDVKMEIARELGVYDTVKSEGWGSVSSRNCGNIVKKALEMRGKDQI